jgi:Zn finger protein HypA/HybF involved in hydrogenase expression
MGNSRKKSIPDEEPVVSREILEQAKKSLDTDKIRRVAKCTVCGTDVAPNSTEGLCWVCRRLKISAWRDSDIQQGAQE